MSPNHGKDSGAGRRERTEENRASETRGLVYGFLFGLVIFGGVFLYLRAGLPALLFVLACFAAMLLFSR